jgi:hypothetical protein
MATLEDLPPSRFAGPEASFYDAGQWTASTYFATVSLPPYHRTLLSAARHYLSRGGGNYRFAVVLAQTACEFLTERVIGHLLEARQVKYLEEWIQGRLRPCHVGNQAVRELCKLLPLDGPIQFSGDFLDRYGEHVERRNGVVHRGEQPTKEDAERSCAVAEELFRVLEPKLGGKLLPTQPPAPRQSAPKRKSKKARRRP